MRPTPTRTGPTSAARAKPSGCDRAPNWKTLPDNICQLAVQGPLAMKIVQKLVDHPVEQMPYYTFEQTEVAGCEAILSITGYTGSGGCEIYAYNADADRLWEALWKAGEEYGLKNIGLGARDTLRLERILPLRQRYRRHYFAARSGTGLDHQVRRGQGVHRPRPHGTAQSRRGETQTGRIQAHRPRHSAPRLSAQKTVEGAEIGLVTSGTMSPSLKVGIGWVTSRRSTPHRER